MGWKYLEVLIAKMMLGTRKKVHHARQNQKAFWSRGCGVSSPVLGSSVPQAPIPSVRGRKQCFQSRVPASPQVLLMHPTQGPLMSTSPYECPGTHPGVSHHVTKDHAAIVQGSREGLAGGDVLSHLWHPQEAGTSRPTGTHPTVRERG